MEERLPLYQEGASAGVLLRREEGLHTVFAADCPAGEGVRKIWLRGEGGEPLLLGTLLPEGGRWRLTKTIARSNLERRGLTGAVWGEIHAGEPPEAGDGVQPIQAGEAPVFPRDPIIAQSLQAERGGRWQRTGKGWRLAYPWQVGQPMPLLPLFCFARVGRGEVVFLLSESGYPVCEERRI